MCRSARDAALLLEAMTGRPAHDSAVKVRALRIGIPRGVFYDGLDSQVQKAVDDAIATVAKLTAGARDVRLPTLTPSRDLPDLPETYLRIIAAEAYTFHEQRVREHADWYHPGTLRSIRMGASVSAADYIRARQEMERLRADIPTLFAASDLLITPTSPGPAFPFGETRLVFLRNTAPWNLLGLPTISIPCGFTSEGMPVGLQITGAAGRDDAVLALAGAYQNVTDWHKRHPAIS
jgi:aspartyl-tRNA(Asn)/glutamyl-tRNA(Gln) amidotransferase subunit A